MRNWNSAHLAPQHADIAYDECGKNVICVDFLSKPRSYGIEVQSVQQHATHGATVFLAGDRAYKLKRAVKFPYMDYSTVEQRRQMCERELAINRRLAPDLYLEVGPIISDGGSLRFGTEAESGMAVDWVLVMRPFCKKVAQDTESAAHGSSPRLALVGNLDAKPETAP